MRYTADFLYDNEEIQMKLRSEFKALFDQWNSGTAINESDLYSVLDQFPEEWIANTYENRFRHLKWDENEDRYDFAEQVVLPYCIKHGFLVKKKGAKDYEFIDPKIGRMQELDF